MIGVLRGSLAVISTPGVVAQAPVEDTYRDLILASSPVAYWRLGEGSGTTASDETGNHPGTYSGSYSLGVEGSVPNDTAVTLSGGYVEVPHHADLRPNVLTVEAWVKGSAQGTFKYIVSKLGAAGDHASYAIYTANNGLLKGYVALDGHGLLVADPSSPPANVWDGTWHHVALVWERPTLLFYFDGALIDTRTQDNQMEITELPVYIGTFEPGAAGNAFSGSVDEVAIYPTALSEATILEHASGG